MKKLIKADLAGILRLMPTYHPTSAERIEAHIAQLQKAAQTDYLFLNRREKSFMFTLPSVYTPDTYENLTTTHGLATPCVPVVAFLLHREKLMDTRPIGSVTMLDYTAFARDVDVYSALPESVRTRHIDFILKRSAKQTRYCSMLELIQFMKIGR